MLRVNVISAQVEDVQDYMENLEATGAFKDAQPIQDHFDEEGQLETTLGHGLHPRGVETGARRRPRRHRAGRSGRGIRGRRAPHPTGPRQPWSDGP
jgi:hypothetical protein